MLSTGRPLKDLFDRPKPKITWNSLRGMFTTAAQTFVRPVRFVSCCVPWPRASHVVRKLDTVRIATVTIPAIQANALRTRWLTVDQAQPGDKETRGHRHQGGPRMGLDQHEPRDGEASSVTRPDIWRQSQSTMTRPMVTAANSAT